MIEYRIEQVGEAKQKRGYDIFAMRDCEKIYVEHHTSRQRAEEAILNLQRQDVARARW